MTKSIRSLSIILGSVILFLGIVFLVRQLNLFPVEKNNILNLNNQGHGDAVESGQTNFSETKIVTDETSTDSQVLNKILTTDATQAIVLRELNFNLDFSVPNNVWHLGHLVRTQTSPGSVSNNQNLILSATAQANHWGSDTLTGAVAFEGIAINQSTGTIANAVGVTGTIEQNAAGTITVGKLFEGILGDPFQGTAETLYGLYLPDINVATTNYAIYSAGGQSYHAGNFGIGTPTPKTKLEVDGIIKTIPKSSAICNTDSEGGIYYDSNDRHFYGCNGVSWVQLDNPKDNE